LNSDDEDLEKEVDNFLEKRRKKHILDYTEEDHYSNRPGLKEKVNIRK